MSDALLLALALASNTTGLAWLALSLDTHWEQVRGADPQPRRTVVRLRWLGAAGLAAGLALCLAADHASMAALVWCMLLAAGALAVAFTLSLRPQLLRPAVAWAGREA